MTIERLKNPSAGELDALTDLWEASVRATHDFLAPEDIAFFRQMVRQEALRGVELYVIRKPDSKAPETGTSAGQENRHESRTSGKTGESRRPEGLDENGMFGGFAAFAGIDGDMLEMLFVAPQARGKGVGRQLVEYLVRERGIRRVDVNEQNAQAAGFYARLGFRVTGRDATIRRAGPTLSSICRWAKRRSGSCRSRTCRPTGSMSISNQSQPGTKENNRSRRVVTSGCGPKRSFRGTLPRKHRV